MLVSLICAGFLLMQPTAIVTQAYTRESLMGNVTKLTKTCINFTKIICNMEMAFLLPLSQHKCGFGGLSTVGNKTDVQINIATA